MSKTALPLVYSCSGCSSAAQMCNDIALRLDRSNQAEMSCIAGVGGDVPALVKTAQSGRPILVLDGCPMACALNCLTRHGVVPDSHIQLHEYGVHKRKHEQYDPEQAEDIYRKATAAAASLRSIAAGSVPKYEKL